MPTTCPQCGAPSDGGAECARCGILFARYDPERPRARRAAPSPEPPITLWELFVRSYKVLRWAVLAGLLLVLFLILRPDTAPTIEADVEAPERLEAKLAQLHRQPSGQSPQLRLDEAELNTWMQGNLALAPSAPPKPPPPERPGSMPIPPPATIEEVQSNVRDVRVKIEGDRILGYVLFDIRGKEMSLTLEGKLRVKEGFLRLDADAMKLGSLPIPRATVERAVARLFDSPENREQFRVPASVRDIRIDNGDLVVEFR